MVLGRADPELAFVADNVVDGQAQALGESQTAAVDELERDAVAEANMFQQVMNLGSGEKFG